MTAATTNLGGVTGSELLEMGAARVQVDDKKIFLFPAWPKSVDVHFKLHAPYNTTVEAEWKNGKMISLNVFPEERKKDVVMMLR